MKYIYHCVVVDRVIDGDSIVLKIDMGNRLTWRDTFRLAGIDTPERGKTGAAEATERLTALVSHGINRIETFKPEKYGRYLCDIYIKVDGGELLVNHVMLVESHAVPYSGGKRAAP